jgi:outer membrane protein OmpA-like peptidoglycan-associated protein
MNDTCNRARGTAAFRTPIVRRLVAALAAATLAACQTMPTVTGDATADAVAGAMTGAAARPGEPGCKRIGGNSNTENTVIGAAGGAVIGGALGSSMTRTSSVGARNGALLGALGGAIAGSQFNKLIGMTEQPDGSVRLNIPGSVMFKSGSADISPEFAATLISVAGTVRTYCGLTATVVGHTDNAGSAELNQRLSNERAQSVVAYLARQGVAADRLRAEGRGMGEPIASNATESGRAQNRRVEVTVRATSQ